MPHHKETLPALKDVKNPQTAMAAAMNIQGQMTGLMQMMGPPFRNPDDVETAVVHSHAIVPVEVLR